MKLNGFVSHNPLGIIPNKMIKCIVLCILFLIPEIVECKLSFILSPYTELSCSLNMDTTLKFSLVWSCIDWDIEGRQPSCMQCSRVAVNGAYIIL